MIQTPTAQPTQSKNLFEGAFESKNEFEKSDDGGSTLVEYSDELRQINKDSWADFYRLKTEDMVTESPVSRTEIRHTQIETEFSKPIALLDNKPEKADAKPVFIIEQQKATSSMEEAGLKLDFGKLGKEIGKSLFGALSLFKEIFMDTVTLVVGKKDKKAEKVDPNPDKAKAAAEKKAENQRKQNNIKAFFDGLRVQAASVATVDAIRMETQEKANINKTVKFTESYKGIKDSFGKLTIYAANIFEREQLDQDKKAKKQEKEMKIASVKGPDLNLDKVAEGGFLSSTGGQGAG